MDAQVTAEVRAVDTARECVRDADIVVLATNSRKPVIDASWIAAGAHVTTLGPKSRGAHEFPLVWAGQAAVIASDSP